MFQGRFVIRRKSRRRKRHSPRLTADGNADRKGVFDSLRPAKFTVPYFEGCRLSAVPQNREIAVFKGKNTVPTSVPYAERITHGKADYQVQISETKCPAMRKLCAVKQLTMSAEQEEK